MGKTKLWQIIGGDLLKKNKGFTLIELIIVLALLTGVLAFFWKILGSSSKDAYTINDKIEVQNSVTSLMNIIQQDVQEAKIVLVSDTKYGIFRTVASSDKIYEDKVYEFGDTNNKKTYVFDSASRTLTRASEKKVNDTVNKESAVYNDIVGFSLEAVDKPNYGAKVSIIGSKKNYIGNSPTAETGIIATSAVQVGKYIKYSGGDYAGKWVVLRNTSGLIEIISKESVGNVTLSGSSGFVNCVKLLNDKCKTYVNSTYASSGRSVGAKNSSIEVLDTKQYPIEYFKEDRSTSPTNYVPGPFPYCDTDYMDDIRLIRSKSALKSANDGNIWLASRSLYNSSVKSYYGVNYVKNDGSNGTYIDFDLYVIDENDNISENSYSCGVRPVITLKPGIRIVGGSGTSGSPYEIAIGDSGNNAESGSELDKSRYSLDSTFYTRNTTR